MFEKFTHKPGTSAKGTKVGVIWGQDFDPYLGSRARLHLKERTKVNNTKINKLEALCKWGPPDIFKIII